MNNSQFYKRRKYRQLIFIFTLILTASPLFAQRKTTVKLASLVPENTPWGAAINKMAADWARATNGEVEVIVYHNGSAGDENEVLRKLKLNQIQAAVFTSIGLNEIMPEVMAVSYPFLIRNNDELEAVMSRIKGDLDRKIEQNGFITLAWARSGWVKFFSRTPVLVPNDLRRIKMGTAANDDKMLQAFKIMGYQMVPINLAEIMVFLNGGMIDAIYQSPIFAAGNQVFGIAKNMSSINVAPFFGGILMNNTTWRKIPERYRPQLLAISKKMERDIESSIANLETEAIATMAKYGLKINEPSPQQTQEWYDDTARFENSLVMTNQIFNREYYLRIKNILTDYRRQ
jgi:TRAP-type C4-dicarboxylate transport system substrate-binding protein